MKARDAAHEFGRLFPEVYLHFHRRLSKRDGRLTPQMSAVLQHLALAGPLTVTEAAKHMDRAQSVMSEIVDGLVRKGLLERMTDARDRRKTLVWLTDAAQRTLAREREVLSDEHVERAMTAMRPEARRQLVEGLQALVRAAGLINAKTEAES